MLALRWSFGWDLFAIALLGATTLAAAPHHHCCRARHAPIIVVEHAPIEVELVDLVDPAKACAEAEGFYERREFDHAATSLRRAVALDPGLEAHAQLYDQLARAWDRASAPEATAVDRFESLRFARRLDLSLGGLYADELDAHLREAAPLAAISYAHDRNREGLELALTTCDALGIAVERSRVTIR
ncbi:MAG: hypothetical protein ABI678_09170 [Kofleriaceae bacterium]